MDKSNLFLFFKKFDNKKAKYKNLFLFFSNSIFLKLFFIILLKGKINNTDYNNFITIEIKGEGTQTIYKNDFIRPQPIQIIINDKNQDFNSNKYNLENNTNTIIIIWNKPLINCKQMLYRLKNITKIDLSKLDSSHIISMESMLEGCLSFSSVNLDGLDISKVQSMSHMFYNCISLISLNFNCLNVSNEVNDISYMFYSCKQLTSLNLNNLRTSNVKNMKNIFYDCHSLTSLDLYNFNTQNVENMNSIFSSCGNLTYLNIRSFDTSKVADMGSMFSGCISITSLDLSNFNTLSVKDMKSIFNGCRNLSFVNLKTFDTSKVEYMNKMFYSCSSLISLELNNFDTSEVKDMSEMFSKCENLKYIYNTTFVVPKVTSMDSMFSDCISLISFEVNFVNSSNLMSISFMFYNCRSLTSLDLHNFDISNVEIMDSTFLSCENLAYINLQSLNTSKVKDMRNLFNNCISITSLDLNNFNTSNVENMNFMFYHCTNLVYLNLKSFETSKVKYMNSMFHLCTSLISIDLNNFDISEVISMSSFFASCYNLKYFNITIFNAKKLTSMDGMFSKCSSLISIATSFFTTSDLSTMSSMFYNCSSLISLDLFNINTSNVKNMNSMFSGCTNLRYININSFSTSKVTDMGLMFYDCHSLTCLDLHNFNTSEVTSINKMFHGCSSLISLNIDNFSLSKANNIINMFYGCCSLISLNLFKLHTPLLTQNMFSNCNPKLIYCIDDSKSYSYLTQLHGYNNCSDICFTYPGHKFIIQKNKCIDKCENDDIYKYEHNNICYSYCPNETYINYQTKECLEYIPEGYNLNIHDNKTIYKCDNKCNNCSFESMVSNLCISCNEKNNYYPVERQNSSFIECLDSNNSDGFYLDNNTYTYKECFPSCKKCHTLGDINDHNCIECKNNYTFINNSNCFEICRYYYFFNSLNEYKCTSKNECPSDFNKLIKDKNQCIDNCKKDEKYKYEYKNVCYEYVIEDTVIPSYSELLDNKNRENITQYNISDILYKIINNRDKDNNNDLLLKLKEVFINGKLNPPIINMIEDDEENIKILDNGINYQFTSTFNQNNNDKYKIKYYYTPSYDQNSINYNKTNSKILLGQCEFILRNYYNISEKIPLFIYIVDIYVEGYLIPIVEYEVYDLKTRKQLNLTLCENMKVQIIHQVDIDEKNIFKYNPSNPFYNDICYTYTTDNKTDIILKDRQNEYINNNLSLCEANCEFKEYNIKNKNAECNCLVKIKFPLISEIIINKDKFLNNFVEIKNYINLNVMKCYRVLFTKEGLVTNIGNYIIFSIIFININLLVAFLLKGYSILYNKIDMIIENRNKNNEKNDIDNIEIMKINGRNKNTFNQIIKRELDINSNIIITDNIKDNIINEETNNNPPKHKNKEAILTITNDEIKSKSKSYSKLINKKNVKIMQKGNNNYIRNEQNIFENNKNLAYYNDYEINNLSYKEAISMDKRSYFEYYISLLKSKQLLIFTFCANDDYNSKIIKISLFFFSFSLYLTINALFFNDSTMHKIYEDQGDFNFIYQIPIILYSSIITFVINFIISFLSLTQKQILKLKKDKIDIKESAIKVKKCLVFKFIFFFLFIFLFLIFFWYYLSCFCAVYKNTQMHLIKDTVISFGMSLLYPFGLCLMPGILRFPALRAKNRNKECLYKFSQYIQ